MISWFLNQQPGHTACCSCSILHSDCSEIWISKNEISTEQDKNECHLPTKILTMQSRYTYIIHRAQFIIYTHTIGHRTGKFYFPNSTISTLYANTASPRPLQKVYEPIPVYSPDFNERYPGHKHRGLITVSKLLLFRIFLRKLSCDFSALPFTPLFIN